MEPNEVLEIAISAGEMLLSNGAEAYRVEGTIEKISEAYGLNCECMATAKEYTTTGPINKIKLRTTIALTVNSISQRIVTPEPIGSPYA